MLQDEETLHLQALQEQVNAQHQRGCFFLTYWRFLGLHVQNTKVREAHFCGLIVLLALRAYQCSEVLSILDRL